jgi:type II secretory pathway component PulF
MALLITPGQLAGRAELFNQLAQVTASGIGLIAALEMLQRNPPRLSMRPYLARMVQQLESGDSLGTSLEQSGRWLSSFDVAMLKAGEQSGRLPDCFRVLANYYTQRAQLARQVIGFAIYPLVVFHMAVFLFPIPLFTDLILQGRLIPFLLQKILVLGPIYGIAFFIVFAMQSTHGELWRATVERFTAMVPLLGKARRNLSIARLSLALDALLNAGVNMIESWELAAAASGSPALRRVVTNFKPQMLNGRTPSEMVSSHREFPSSFATLYHSGEISGTLDQSLKRAAVFHEEDGSRQMKTFIFGFAGVLYGCVMLLAAWQIIAFYARYFQSFGNLLDGKF